MIRDKKERGPAPEAVTYAMPESTNELYFFFYGNLELAFKNTRYFPFKQPSTPLSKKRKGKPFQVCRPREDRLATPEITERFDMKWLASRAS